MRPSGFRRSGCGRLLQQKRGRRLRCGPSGRARRRGKRPAARWQWRARRRGLIARSGLGLAGARKVETRRGGRRVATVSPHSGHSIKPRSFCCWKSLSEANQPSKGCAGAAEVEHFIVLQLSRRLLRACRQCGQRPSSGYRSDSPNPAPPPAPLARRPATARTFSPIASRKRAGTRSQAQRPKQKRPARVNSACDAAPQAPRR